MHTIQSHTDDPHSYAKSSAEIAMTAHQSYRSIYNLLSSCLSKHDLTLAQWNVLSSLYGGPKTHTQLTRIMASKPAYVNRIVNQLRGKGDLFTQVEVYENRRSRPYVISEEGKQFFVHTEAMLQECLNRELVKKISPSELDVYFTVSDYIANNVKEEVLHV